MNAPPSQAGYSFGFSGGPIFKLNQPVLDPTETQPDYIVTSKYGSTLAVGITEEYRFETRKKWSVELGTSFAFQPIRQTATDGNSSGYADRINQLVRIPFQLRYYSFKYLQFGLGAYYDFSLSGLSDDLGVSASARVQLKITSSLALTNEVRFNQSIVTYRGGVRPQEFAITVGFRYGALF